MPLLHETTRRARNLTAADIAVLEHELKAGVEGEVKAGRADRLLYATDASMFQMEPVAVLWPKSVEDVQHAVRVAAKAGIPVMPRGGGTGLAGQTVNHAIVMDFTPHMHDVLEINREEEWVRAQPGLVLAELNRAAAKAGLQYAIDPSTANRATIGGSVGNNSCGAHSVIYGKSIDQVLDLDVVLSDASRSRLHRLAGPSLEAKLDLPGLEGSIYRELRRLGHEHRAEVEKRFPKIMRRVSGYNLDDFTDRLAPMDLSRMVVGSEGTLAVVTEARVKLRPVPQVKGLAVVHFGSVVEAAMGTLAALEHDPSAVELVDEVIIRRCRANPSFRHLVDFLVDDPGGILLIEFYCESEDEATSRIQKLEDDLKRRGLGYATVSTTDPARQREIWRMREAGLGILLSVRGDSKPVAFVEDAAVAPEKLPEFVRRFQEIVGRHGTTASFYGHASVGCLHVRPMANVKSSEGLKTMEAIATEVADLVLEFEGSLSGEHGDGILRGVFTERMFGPQLTDAFRDVKKAFDPDMLLNPGKIVDTPRFNENLRIGPETLNWEPVTFLDFRFEGGMARAAEQCNGQAACRKLEGGMCPSFMVTLDEEHSTRGRANLLRLSMAGVLPPESLTGDRIFDALDLCVECKACKAECPSGVDMAKLKYEVLAQRNKEHGVPLRARLFANIALLSKAGSKTPALANFVNKLGPVRQALQRFGGIHAGRPLPVFAHETFPDWFNTNARRSTSAAPRGDVVLFDDTFTDYYNPEVGRAATKVLEALGYRVIVVERTACCGRPAISKGMLTMAKKFARQNVDVLLPYAQRGVFIVGTEPSCLLSFRDEYPDLLRDEASRTVAGQALLLDELIARLIREDDTVAQAFKGEALGEVLVHTHCHQKAGAGSEPTIEALRMAGYTPKLIDSGCCGMAGSFGFEAEHYDISKAMGALRLFPAVEGAAPSTPIAITGVSCRQQIGHFTSRKPRHAVELLADALRTRQ